MADAAHTGSGPTVPTQGPPTSGGGQVPRRRMTTPAPEASAEDFAATLRTESVRRVDDCYVHHAVIRNQMRDMADTIERWERGDFHPEASVPPSGVGEGGLAEVLWKADGYDLNADPDSRTARELRPEYEAKAAAVDAWLRDRLGREDVRERLAEALTTNDHIDGRPLLVTTPEDAARKALAALPDALTAGEVDRG